MHLRDFQNIHRVKLAFCYRLFGRASEWGNKNVMRRRRAQPTIAKERTATPRKTRSWSDTDNGHAIKMRPAVSRFGIPEWASVTSGNFRNRNRVARMIDGIAQGERSSRLFEKSSRRSTAAMFSLILSDRRISLVSIWRIWKIHSRTRKIVTNCFNLTLKYSKSINLLHLL